MAGPVRRGGGGGGIDRNQMARAQFLQQQEHNQQMTQMRNLFASDFALGKAAVLDRFGTRLQKGDLVLWTPPYDMIYTIASVEPVMDERAQPGFARVTFHAVIPIDVQVNMHSTAMILVGRQGVDGTPEINREISKVADAAERTGPRAVDADDDAGDDERPPLGDGEELIGGTPDAPAAPDTTEPSALILTDKE